MTIKTLAAVVGTLAIIVVLFFITKITTPSRLVAKSGFFAGSSTDDWGRGTGATGFWEPIEWKAARADASVSNSALLVEPKLAEKVEPKPRRERARR